MNFTLAGSLENRRSDGAAILDVETVPIALRIGRAKADQAGIGPAIQDPAALDLSEGLLRLCTSDAKGSGDDEQRRADHSDHVFPLSGGTGSSHSR
jgi:hypothetical protein